MSKHDMEKLITLMVNEDSDPAIINNLFSACVFERIKEKLKERDEFLHAAFVSMNKLNEDDSEDEDTEEDDSGEEKEDKGSEETSDVSFPPCDSFDVETALVSSLITLNVDVEGLSDEDKDFIESYMNGDISEEDKQTLLSSIYGDGEWTNEMPAESFEAIKDPELFEDAEAFETPTEGLMIVLVNDPEEESIKVFAAKAETSEEI
jgi:hypothetical protein